jgi:Xaa-Pro dipeptidase
MRPSALLTIATGSRHWKHFVRAGLLAIVVLSLPGAARAQASQTPPKPDLDLPVLLSLSEQMAVRESWLPKRYDLLLQIMRRQGIDMWIVVNEEFHNDPAVEYIAPPRPYVGNRDFFVFVDGGDKGLKKFAVSSYAEENLRRFFESPEDPKPADKVLPELVATYNPAKIALNMAGGRGVMRSLTHDAYLFLTKTLGSEASAKFVSAADLVEEYFDTRIPEEFETYSTLVRATEVLARRALSNEVVTPGKTTAGDIRRWLYDQVGALGLRTWFQPDIRVYGKGADSKISRGFPAVADEATVIQRGNIIHLDFGMTYMGFDSDWQKNAYVLLPGETDVPAGLKTALANTNLLQDALMIRASRPGLSAGLVTQKAMEETAGKGFDAYIYCHPIGYQGHGLGAALGYGFRPGSKADPASMPKLLRKGSYISIELNTFTAIPEWGGKKIPVAEEDDAYLTDEGWKFFRPRQDRWYLIR